MDWGSSSEKGQTSKRFVPDTDKVHRARAGRGQVAVSCSELTERSSSSRLLALSVHQTPNNVHHGHSKLIVANASLLVTDLTPSEEYFPSTRKLPSPLQHLESLGIHKGPWKAALGREGPSLFPSSLMAVCTLLEGTQQMPLQLSCATVLRKACALSGPNQRPSLKQQYLDLTTGSNSTQNLNQFRRAHHKAKGR